MTGTKAMALDQFCRDRGQGLPRFDYSGHGASGGAFRDGTIGGWLQDAIDVFDRLTAGPQILVGSSMGGWIMLLLALRRRDRVAGLIGLAPAPDFTEDIWRDFSKAHRQELLTRGAVERPSAYSDSPYVIARALIEEGRQHLLLGGAIEIDLPGAAAPWHGRSGRALREILADRGEVAQRGCCRDFDQGWRSPAVAAAGFATIVRGRERIVGGGRCLNCRTSKSISVRWTARHWPTAAAYSPGQSLPAALGRSAAEGVRGTCRAQAFPSRQAHRVSFRWRPLSGAASDDRRPAALDDATGAPLPGKLGLAAFDFAEGTLMLTEAGSKKRASLHVVARRGGAGAARSRRDGSLDGDARGISRSAAPGEPHAEARADRSRISSAASATPTPTRSCITPQLSPVKLTPSADRRRVRPPAHATRTVLRRWTDRCCAQRDRRRVPGEGHRVPAGDGRARPVRQALPGLRRAGAAHRLRRQRDQLLPALPDRRQDPGRSLALRLLKSTGRGRSRSWRNHTSA